MATIDRKDEYGATGYDVNGQDHMALHPNDSHENALRKIRTAGSVTIPPELFEKLYLNPEEKVKGDLRRTFGNPTPIGLGGFLLSLTPLSCYLMNWRNTQAGMGASNIPVYLFFGGVLMNVAAVLEWILGNTFISVVFSTFGCFWLTYGGVLQPFYGASSHYSPDPVNAPQEGASTPEFVNSWAFFLLWMGVLCLVYLICAIRTNLVFFCILLPLPAAFGLLAAANWYAAMGEMAYSGNLQIAAGALTFITDILGWYLFTSLLLASIDAPFQLPVFDLSTKIPGASSKSKAAQRTEADLERG